jgi:hypothetical protein
MTDIPELTDAEKLAAIGTYIKVLTGMEKQLRAAVEQDMGKRRVEKVGAYLPGGTKMASVARSNGRKTATVTNPANAMIWVRSRYPDAIVESINPAFLKKLTDYAQRNCAVGEHGVDPRTGEELPFIDVTQGSPYVTITTTEEGVAAMTSLAHGFAGMLEGSEPEPEYDPDQLENGGYR